MIQCECLVHVCITVRPPTCSANMWAFCCLMAGRGIVVSCSHLQKVHTCEPFLLFRQVLLGFHQQFTHGVQPGAGEVSVTFLAEQCAGEVLRACDMDGL